MKAIIEGYVVTVRKGENGKIGSFEFLVIGDGGYQPSTIIRVVGDGVKPSLVDKLRIEIVSSKYVDKKSGQIMTYWRKTETPAVSIKG